MTAPKTGPLTEAELLDVWKGALDRSYRDPLLLAGEGNGLEAHTQALSIFARTSRAVDKTTQAMFICPWSGQSDEPAASGEKATVTLTFLRTSFLDRPMVLGAGLVYVEEQTTDWGENGGVEVETGRRYTLLSDLVFHPGDAGPYTVEAEAEKVGYGYNNPLPGTLRLISQPAANFENNLATVSFTPGVISGATLLASNQVFVSTPNEPDTFVPDHVGQYMYFTEGANLRRTARILQFFGPDLTAFPAIGSKVLVEWDESAEGTTFAGTFLPGERIRVGAALTPTLLGTVLGERVVGGRKRVTFVLGAATTPLVAGAVLTGNTSGATLTVGIVLYPNGFTAEAPVASVGGATWRILDWDTSWGLVVSNIVSPDGGRSPWLDELGQERSLSRAPNETDDLYRQRIKAIADVVTPNAIRRTLSRTLGSMPWCFREVGTDALRGWFFDGDLSPVGSLTTLIVADKNDAWDTDCVLFGGATGMTYDAGVLSAYDSGAYLSFYGGWGEGTFSAIPLAAQNEPAVLEDASNNVYMTGYFGRLLAGPSNTIILVFVRRSGRLPAVSAGLRVRGLVSGATFATTGGSIPQTAIDRRYRMIFDYEQFRGFFLIGLPRLAAGEFGFPYDQAPTNAYDVSVAFDGFPRYALDVHRRVWQAIDAAKAGGVGFELYVEEIGCP